MDNEWIESIIKRNHTENEILKVLKFQSYEDTVSVIKRCKLEMILTSGRKKNKTFVVKVKLKGKKAEALKEMEPFKTETKIYDVLNQMECLMDEFYDKRETLWCQMYGYIPNSVIVFDDLKELGYEDGERRICLNLNQAKLYLRSIGRFHAMSRILIDRGLLSATDIHPFYIAKMWDAMKFMFECGAGYFSKIVLERWPAEWKEFGLKVQKLQPVTVHFGYSNAPGAKGNHYYNRNITIPEVPFFHKCNAYYAICIYLRLATASIRIIQ